MIIHAERDSLLQQLHSLSSSSLDFVLLISGALPSMGLHDWQPYLEEAIRVLAEGGLLFVQGTPSRLPELGIYLDRRLQFKYWIAVESAIRYTGRGLPSAHAAILMFSKGSKFEINRVRFPHEMCRACGKPLRDWGGKAYLMHPEGFAISDVWKGLPALDNYTGISRPVLETLLKLVNPKMSREASGLIGPCEGLTGSSVMRDAQVEYRSGALQYTLPGFEICQVDQKAFDVQSDSEALWNTVIQGDALEVLKKYPSDSVDLVFADPPYNLDKAYNVYNDEKDRQAYLNWCNSWLDEYIRILKPTGSLYVLNLPRWAMYHAAYLNKRLCFQNWIVWDALSEPRGKLMPAHYALLFYTKHPTQFTFNYEEIGKIDARVYCLRSSCVRRRKAKGEDLKEPLTDIWWDIHRLKHRRDRDYHPCQLPDALLERIIRLSTKPGDIVLDALAGTGTTAVVAASLARRYVAIDIDEAYVRIIREKIAQVRATGTVQRPSVRRPKSRYSKKMLQLELRDIAARLGRLPTPEDVQRMSRFGLDAFLETFPTWGKALKAAKLEVQNGNRST